LALCVALQNVGVLWEVGGKWLKGRELLVRALETLEEEFAERFSVRMEQSFQALRARHVLVKGDGADARSEQARQELLEHFHNWCRLARSKNPSRDCKGATTTLWLADQRWVDAP